jgi:hypothetical protein
MPFEPWFHCEKSPSRDSFSRFTADAAYRSKSWLERDAARYKILNERLTTRAHTFPDTQADASSLIGGNVTETSEPGKGSLFTMRAVRQRRL